MIIGVGTNEHALRARFDACLLDDEEFAGGFAAWSSLHDPFEIWSVS